MKAHQKPTAIYRGHPYSLRTRGRGELVSYAAVNEFGEVVTQWHWSASEAAAEFKAGVDDILGEQE